MLYTVTSFDCLLLIFVVLSTPWFELLFCYLTWETKVSKGLGKKGTMMKKPHTQGRNLCSRSLRENSLLIEKREENLSRQPLWTNPESLRSSIFCHQSREARLASLRSLGDCNAPTDRNSLILFSEGECEKSPLLDFGIPSADVFAEYNLLPDTFKNVQSWQRAPIYKNG